MKYILVASIKPEVLNAINKSLSSEYKIESALDKKSCLNMFCKKRYEFAFIDMMLLRGSMNGKGHIDYYQEIQPFKLAFPTAEIIVISPLETIREAVNAVKAGASDYITYPIDPEEVRHVCEIVYEALRKESELNHFRNSFLEIDTLEILRTNNEMMKNILDKVNLVAPTITNVLLTGETGTGKGVIAKVIHFLSTKRDRQFISVHCGAIPDTLLESELFGHEKGAFTGAFRRKLGKFEIAQDGTIFLDEIGTISASAQVKLLQILQDRTFQRVGGEVTLKTNVRIIAASNMDLKKMCEEGCFRTDLYYRLNTFPIEIPPLRKRREDIPILVEILLKRLNKYYSKEIHAVHSKVMEAFERYPWPGNIRELENLMGRAYILEASSILTPESFPSELFQRNTEEKCIPLYTSLSLAEMRKKTIEDMEQHYLTQLLALHKGKINTSAKAAGISPRQIRNLLTKYGINKEKFK